MKMVQTFWTARRPLLEHSFGWLSPQCHLMTWALSCLSLREHYDNVVLYADSEGCRVLADLLKLPYTEVVAAYDTLSIPDVHWAYPKLLTYSVQDAPFIHVDGDVVLAARLETRMEAAALVAQNKETGTQYYRGIMNDLLRRNYRMPSCLFRALERDSVPSYNAGFLGGSDLDFIREYCDMAFRFVRDNGLDEPGYPNANVNNNLLFEQVLLAALAEERGKTVETVAEFTVPDNGNDYRRFCDFYRYDRAKFFHLLGGHKRNKRICELVGKTLLSRYPEHYRRIVELFPKENKRIGGAKQVLPDMTVQQCIALYQDYLCDRLGEWKSLSVEELYRLEKRLSDYSRFLGADKEAQLGWRIGKNPYVSVFELPRTWPGLAKVLLKERINRERSRRATDIACLPCLLGEGYKETLLTDWGYNLLALLDEEKPFGKLMEELRPCLPPALASDEEGVYRSMLAELEPLFYDGVLYATPDESTDVICHPERSEGSLPKYGDASTPLCSAQHDRTSDDINQYMHI